MPRTPQIDALPGCTPLGIKPNPLNELVRIANSPCTHDWVRKLIPELMNKDCVDVVHDLGMLFTLFNDRLIALNQYHSGK